MSGIELHKVKRKKTAKVKSEGSENWLSRDISLFNSGLSDSRKQWFYSEMSILIKSGLDIRYALDLVQKEQSSEKVKKIIIKIKDLIVGGKSLNEAMRLSGHFSPYEYFSIEIGEETGNLKSVLDDLKSYYDRKVKQRRQLISALSYPLMVILTAVFVLFFMLNYIVPMFEDVFTRFGGELPAITKAVLNISHFMNSYFLYFFSGLAVVFMLLFVNRRKTWFRKYSTATLLKLPLVGEQLTKIYVARFCHVMRLLIGAGVPMIKAIDMTSKMIGFYPLEAALIDVKKEIIQGVAFHKSLAKHSIFSGRVVALMKVGEEVNQLENIFDELSEQLTNEIEHKTSLLSAILEPFLIIFLAIVVGTILIAMYLPILQLSLNVG